MLSPDDVTDDMKKHMASIVEHFTVICRRVSGDYPNTIAVFGPSTDIKKNRKKWKRYFAAGVPFEYVPLMKGLIPFPKNLTEEQLNGCIEKAFDFLDHFILNEKNYINLTYSMMLNFGTTVDPEMHYVIANREPSQDELGEWGRQLMNAADPGPGETSSACASASFNRPKYRIHTRGSSRTSGASQGSSSTSGASRGSSNSSGVSQDSTTSAFGTSVDLLPPVFEDE